VKILDLAAFAGGALTGHRLRTVLSIAGVAVGIGAVIALTALGEGARGYVTNEFMSLGSNLLIVMPGKVETSGMGPPMGGVTHDLTLDDYLAVKTRLPRVKRAAAVCVATERIRYESHSRSVPIIGATHEYMDVRGLAMGSGNFIAPGDPNRGGAEIVLGATVARELFGAENPLGEVVRMGTWRLRVVGVLAPKGRSLGFNMDDLAIIPVRTAMSAFNRNTLFRILIQTRSPDEMDAARKDVIALIAERHRTEDITVITQDAVISAFTAILRALTLALAGIASVSLAVAGVGIMNVMLISVTERKAEIGLLKAIGATRRQVIGVFLTEAVLIACLGGVVGLVTGFGAVRLLVAIYPAFPAHPPAWAVGAALATSFAVGVGFGLWPAVRATRLDPVAALSRR